MKALAWLRMNNCVRDSLLALGRIGKAVVRNRVRRRIREALRGRLSQLASGRDILVVARPAASRATWSELNAAIDALLKRSGATHSEAAGV